MSELFVAGYPNLAKAREVQDRLLHLQADQRIAINDLVVVENQAGHLQLHQPRGTVSMGGSLSGALGGGLIGLLYLAPLLGWAAHGPSGGLGGGPGGGPGLGGPGGGPDGGGGGTAVMGMDESLRKHLTRTLTPGSAVVLTLVAPQSAGALLAELAPHEGLLLRCALDAQQEATLQQAVTAARALTAAN
jgi:uncharacterized membrane protein